MAEHVGRIISETYMSSLMTVKTSHASYDRVIICDIDGPKKFIMVTLDYKDMKGRTLREIFNYDAEMTLSKANRIAFRDVYVQFDSPPRKWAIFARVETGVEEYARQKAIKDLNDDIKNVRPAELQHYYINTMATSFLEKLAKSYNYPKKDPRNNKFHIVKYGERSMRNTDTPFPVTDETSDPSPAKVAPAEKKKEKTKKTTGWPSKESASQKPSCSQDVPATGEVSPRKRKSSGEPRPTKKTATGLTVSRPLSFFESLSDDDFVVPSSQTSTGSTSKQKAKATATKKTPSKKTPKGKTTNKSPKSSKKAQTASLVTIVPNPMAPPVAFQDEPQQMEIQEGQGSVYQQVDDNVTYVVNDPQSNEQLELATNDSVQNLLSTMGSELVQYLDNMKRELTDSQRFIVMNVLENQLPKIIDKVIDEKLNAILTSVDSRLESLAKQSAATDKQVKSLLDKSSATNQWKKDLSKAVSSAVAKQGQMTLRMKGSSAEKRAAGAAIISTIVPFNYVGTAFDIFWAADITRKHFLNYISSTLDSIELENAMNTIAQTVIDALLTPIASAHFAVGDSKIGRAKMMWHKRCLPKVFMKWLKGPVVNYVKKQFASRGMDWVENFLRCRGGLQNRFSNDRQTMEKVAVENSETSEKAALHLWHYDRAFSESNQHATPNYMKKPSFDEYKKAILDKGPVKKMFEDEQRGLKPKAGKHFPDVEFIFDEIIEGHGSIQTEFHMYQAIATLATATGVDPKSVNFQKSKFAPNMHEIYLELLGSGALKVDEALRKFKLSTSDLGGVVECSTTSDSAKEGSAADVESFRKEGSSDIEVPKTKKKKKRVIKSSRGYRQAEREGRTGGGLADDSTTTNEDMDKDKSQSTEQEEEAQPEQISDDSEEEESSEDEEESAGEEANKSKKQSTNVASDVEDVSDVSSSEADEDDDDAASGVESVIDSDTEAMPPPPPPEFQ